jgi:Protein of unknown function (DUF1501).
LAPKEPHFAPKAKTVIWLHQAGAPSTLDLFDYKPELIRLHGTGVPESFLQGIKTSTQGGVTKLIATNRTWKQYGESGAWFSDLLPNLAQHADDIAFIKSSVTIGATHDISILKLNTSSLNPRTSLRLVPGCSTHSVRPIRTCRPSWCSTTTHANRVVA